MLSSNTEGTDANGNKKDLAGCLCNVCDNTFFVACAPENEPRYCCYCGVKFMRYTTAEGKTIRFEGNE